MELVASVLGLVLMDCYWYSLNDKYLELCLEQIKTISLLVGPFIISHCRKSKLSLTDIVAEDQGNTFSKGCGNSRGGGGGPFRNYETLLI